MKAATLGELARAGFPVPDGFVLTTDAFDRFLAANDLGPDISPEAVIAATLPTRCCRCSARRQPMHSAIFPWQSAPLGVPKTYLRPRSPGSTKRSSMCAGQRPWSAPYDESSPLPSVLVSPPTVLPRDSMRERRMAVLVQHQVEATAAGVAFTANPVTGDRAETVISAVRGSGERLVSGQATPDEWIVRNQEAMCRAAPEGAIDADQALAVAALARRVEAHFGGIPQDIEWALVGDELFLLQARPITALPEPVVWKASLPGAWARHIRLGEWLGDPVTPLFESWGLTADRGTAVDANQRQLAGVPAPHPMHIVVNGWYFCSLGFLPSSPASMLWRLLRYALPKALVHPRRVAMTMPSTAKFGVEVFVREWRTELLPRYQALVQQNASRVDQLDAPDLVHLVEELAGVAGDYFTSITAVAGFAWKAEMPLAAFYRKYLFPRIGGSHQRLLCGLSGVSLVSASHAVACLDWFDPTVGERSPPSVIDPDPEALNRLARAKAERLQAEAEARSALAHEPKLLAQFEKRLATAQRFGVIREEQVASFTLGWPLMRRALLRLGELLVERGCPGDRRRRVLSDARRTPGCAR